MTVYCAINPGKPTDVNGSGNPDSANWTVKAKQLADIGVQYCTMQMPWSMMQSAVGGSVTAGATKAVAFLDAMKAGGLKVVIDLSLHYSPPFVTSNLEQFKDQNATQWFDTDASGNNVRNWQWTSLGRTYVSDLITKIGTDARIPAHSAVAGVRLGGGYAGEAHYAPIVTSPMQWWIYGTSCQTGGGIASDQVACPFPGRTPLFDGSNDTADHAIANWWLNGMNVWIVWLIAQLQAAGFGSGLQQLWVLHPSTGVRDRPHTDSGWIQEVARGVDPRRLMGAYRWSKNVWPWSTWNDNLGTGTSETGMGSCTYLLELARQYGKLGWFADENTHTNSDMAGCYLVHSGQSSDSPNGAAGKIFNWLHRDSLTGGAFGDTTLAQYQSLIAANP
jgi:hypothetical protein